MIECKLKQKHEAFLQMELLYKPLLEYLYQMPVSCVQAVKYLIDENLPIVSLDQIKAGDLQQRQIYHAFDL